MTQGIYGDNSADVVSGTLRSLSARPPDPIHYRAAPGMSIEEAAAVMADLAAYHRRPVIGQFNDVRLFVNPGTMPSDIVGDYFACLRRGATPPAPNDIRQRSAWIIGVDPAGDPDYSALAGHPGRLIFSRNDAPAQQMLPPQPLPNWMNIPETIPHRIAQVGNHRYAIAPPMSFPPTSSLTPEEVAEYLLVPAGYPPILACAVRVCAALSVATGEWAISRSFPHRSPDLSHWRAAIRLVPRVRREHCPGARLEVKHEKLGGEYRVTTTVLFGRTRVTAPCFSAPCPVALPMITHMLQHFPPYILGRSWIRLHSERFGILGDRPRWPQRPPIDPPVPSTPDCLLACFDCDRNITPMDAWIGKETDTCLCERCLDKRIARGSAKKSAKQDGQF